MIVAEGRPYTPRASRQLALQWGRNLIVAEGMHLCPNRFKK